MCLADSPSSALEVRASRVSFASLCLLCGTAFNFIVWASSPAFRNAFCARCVGESATSTELEEGSNRSHGGPLLGETNVSALSTGSALDHDYYQRSNGGGAVAAGEKSPSPALGPSSRAHRDAQQKHAHVHVHVHRGARIDEDESDPEVLAEALRQPVPLRKQRSDGPHFRGMSRVSRTSSGWH